MAGVALAARQVPFEWPVCYFQYLHRSLRKRDAWDTAAFCRGRRGTFSASGSICVAGVLLSTCIDVCGSVTPGTPLPLVMAGVALSAPQVPFLGGRYRCLRKFPVCASRAAFAWQACLDGLGCR